MGLNYEDLSQRFVLLFWLSITIQLLRFKALFKSRLDSITPATLRQGQFSKRTKDPTDSYCCDIGNASAHCCASARGPQSNYFMDLPFSGRNH